MGEEHEQAYKLENKQVTELAKALKVDRTIEIYVGDEIEPYHVLQSTLEHASDYFAKAIKNEHLGEGNIGVLRFPEDDPIAWEYLLYWIVRHDLPRGYWMATNASKEANAMILAQCWILGDMYFMPELQDFVMMKLLLMMSVGRTVFEDPAIFPWIFQRTSEGSPLRRLFVQTAVQWMFYEDGSFVDFGTADCLAIDAIAQCTGAMRNILQARDEFHQNGGKFELDRLDYRDKRGNNAAWLSFMVEEPSHKNSSFLRRQQVLQEVDLWNSGEYQ